MPPSPPLTPVQFLTAANLVTAALQLYRQQFKPFFRLSAIAHLWLLLLLLSLAAIFLPGTLLGGDSPLLVLLRIACVGLVVWSGAKYLTLSAALSRLSFHQLLRWAESTQAAARYANKRLWGFWWIGFLTALLLFALAFGVILALSVIVSMVSLVVGGVAMWGGGGALNEAASVVFGIFIVLVGLVLLTAAGLSLLWCVARLFIPEVAYAVEPELRPIEAIGRSWNLTNQNGWRMVGMIFVLFTVLLPLQVIYQVINGALQAGFVFLSPSDSETSSVFLASLVGSYALSLVFNCFMLPVWQATKAIAYYDLRSRREGMGLNSFDSGSASASLDDVLDPTPVDSGTLSPRQAPPPDTVMGLFNRVKLLTPESVELEFMLAGLGSRALALTIDYGIVLTGVLLFWVVWGWLASQLMSYLEGMGANYNQVPLWLLAIGLLVTFIFTTGYFAGFEVLRQGQTPGKRFARIRVIRDDGRPVGVSQAVLRSLLQAIDYFFFLGAFMIFLGKQEKRVGDWVAGTLVIQETRATKQTISLSLQARELAIELPRLTTMTQLQPHHFAVIREYLQRRFLMERQARNQVSLDLARQIRTVIQLETVPENLNSDEFLEAVYLAYQEQFPAY